MSKEANKESKVRRFGSLEYWAENGMISLYDNKDGSFKRISASDWRDRGWGIGEGAKVQTDHKERIRIEGIANDMIEAADEAIAQGDPMSDEVQKYHARHKHHLKKSVIFNPGRRVPGGIQRPSGLILPN